MGKKQHAGTQHPARTTHHRERAVVVQGATSRVLTAVPRWLTAAGYRVVADPDANSVDAEVIVLCSPIGTGDALRMLEAARRLQPIAPVLALVDQRARISAEPLLTAGASFVMFLPADPPALVLRVAEMVRCSRDLREELHQGACDIDRQLVRTAAAARLAETWRLSRREREILPLAVIGEAHKDISSRLALSLRMVRWHADNIRHKSGCTTWAEIRVRWAREMGA